jgi:aryl-alcohol dehydrogenase-like predicted oxidoreductase
MEMRKFGGKGMRASVIGLGCNKLSATDRAEIEAIAPGPA